MGFFRSNNKDKKAATDNGPKVVLDIDGMHCTSCGLLIDDELEELPGVGSSSTDVRAGRAVIRLEEGTDVDTAVLIAAVKQAGEYMARLAD